MTAPSSQAVALAISRVESALGDLKALVGIDEPGRVGLKEAAHRLGVHPSTLKRRAAEIENVNARIGNRWSIAEADLPKLEGRPRKPS